MLTPVNIQSAAQMPLKTMSQPAFKGTINGALGQKAITTSLMQDISTAEKLLETTESVLKLAKNPPEGYEVLINDEGGYDIRLLKLEPQPGGQVKKQHIFGLNINFLENGCPVTSYKYDSNTGRLEKYLKFSLHSMPESIQQAFRTKIYSPITEIKNPESENASASFKNYLTGVGLRLQRLLTDHLE